MRRERIERVGNARSGSIPALSWREPRPTAVRTIENRAELNVGRRGSTISASKTGHLGDAGIESCYGCKMHNGWYERSVSLLRELSWPRLLSGLFLMILGIGVLGLLFSPGDKTSAFVALMGIMTGALVLMLLLPRLAEFTIGPQGVTAKINQIKDDLETTKGEVADQRQKVREQEQMMNDLVKYSMSSSIFHHLCGIALLKNYSYSDGESDRREMYFLRDNGFIKPKGHAFLDFNASMHGKNLVEAAEPTPVGWSCVKLRKDEIPVNMLQDEQNIRIDPSSL